ncbi:MAG: polyphosphate--glucose phosphotransferase [Leucobacter sp.]
MGSSKQRLAIGIDVGGTGIKGAGVDPASGALLTTRHKVSTPAGGSPVPIAEAVSTMIDTIRDELADLGQFERAATPPVGVTLPGVVRHGVILTAANIDHRWINTNAVQLLSDTAGVPCTVVNDADAAGLAEADFGAARSEAGAALVLTFGTGIGSALIYEGELVPNFELGHIDLGEHHDYEQYASPKNIEREGITIAEWADRVARYLAHLEVLFTPDLFVIGGGISKSSDEFLPHAGVRAPVVPAHFRNNAGLVGAAALAARN